MTNLVGMKNKNNLKKYYSNISKCYISLNVQTLVIAVFDVQYFYEVYIQCDYSVIIKKCTN